MLPLIMALVNAGLPLLANAVVSKGKDFVEIKTGLKLPDVSFGQALSPADALALKKAETDHQEFLVTAALEDRKIDADLSKSEGADISARWDSDNKTDSWLAKNVRPLLMLALFCSLVLFALMSIPSVGQPIAENWVDLFKGLAQSAFYAYFGGRSVEKTARTIAENWNKKPDTKRP